MRGADRDLAKRSRFALALGRPFTATAADSRIEKVYLSGGGARIAGLAPAFHEKTGYNIEIMNPLARAVPNSKLDSDELDEIAPSLGVAVGLGLRRVES